MKARDLLQTNESALVLYTAGANFIVDEETGNGFTGYWRIGASRVIKRVIIYHRTSFNTIYTADCSHVERETEDGRYAIYLIDINQKGTIV